MKVKFNSWSKEYKSKFGVQKQGESIKIRILFDDEVFIERVDMIICNSKNIFDEMVINMPYVESSYEKKNHINSYSCNISLQDIGIYYYYFKVYFNNKCLLVVQDVDNTAKLKETWEYNRKDSIPKWQLTVTKQDMNDGIMYQIFPDRFARGNKVIPNIPGRKIHKDWNELPDIFPDINGIVNNNDFFGGDFNGIESKILYLKSLGVTMLYFNPFLESDSNHRYNTKNFFRIDPLLGTREDFKKLVNIAHCNGMKIVMDAVFDHVGTESIYYKERYGKYKGWFLEGQCWWGDPTLPKLNLLNPCVQKHIIRVIRFWKDMGVDILRIDVADEIPPSLLKAIKGEIDTILEVWEDVTTKQNKFHLGKSEFGIDKEQATSFMNYPLKNAIITFIRDKKGIEFYKTVMFQMEHYPPEILFNLMNSLSTHDSQRIITALVGDKMPDFEPIYRVDAKRAERLKREWMYNHDKLSPLKLQEAIELLHIALVLQFTYCGFPCIYYGDEIGMYGYIDPYNRKTFPKNHIVHEKSNEIFKMYMNICSLKKELNKYNYSYINFLHKEDDFIMYSKESCGHHLYVVVNLKNKEVKLNFSSFCNVLYGTNASSHKVIMPNSVVLLEEN